MKKIKEPATLDEQINTLIDRNLIINDIEFAKNFLYSVNYYNFSGYLYEFKDKQTDSYNNLNFDTVYNVYMCDKRLKSIVLYAIEIFEHNIKTKFAYVLAHCTGSLGYKDSANFTNIEKHTQFLEHLHHNIEKNKNLPFVKHHITTYGDFPIWVAIELFTIGNIASCYKNLKKELKKKIAAEFKVNFLTLSNWLDCIVYIRNMSAHYMRLYNLAMPLTIKSYKNLFNEFSPTHKLFDVIYAMKYLMPNNNEWNNHIIPNIVQIFCEYDEYVNISAYGFPENWEQHLKI